MKEDITDSSIWKSFWERTAQDIPLLFSGLLMYTFLSLSIQFSAVISCVLFF